jgi:hypothetical protein
MLVRATREGLLGQKTASGWVITPWVPAVALPSIAALHLRVLVTNPLNQRSCRCLVLDVGPHHTGDDAYVWGGARPKAETDPGSNGAGIDLSEFVWNALGMLDNTEVDWTWMDELGRPVAVAAEP